MQMSVAVAELLPGANEVLEIVICCVDPELTPVEHEIEPADVVYPVGSAPPCITLLTAKRTVCVVPVIDTPLVELARFAA